MSEIANQTDYRPICSRLSDDTRGVQEVLQLDDKEEWKCYKQQFIFNIITIEFSAFATFLFLLIPLK